MTNPVPAMTYSGRPIATPGDSKAALRSASRYFLPALVLMAAVWAMPIPEHLLTPSRHLVLHNFLEGFAIFVSVMVFAYGWSTYGATQPRAVTILAAGFLAVGLLDFAHMLSFPGMPVFVTPGSPNKAIYFWLMARLAAAATLLAVAIGHPRGHTFGPHGRRVLFASAVAVAGLCYGLVLFMPDVLPEMFVPGTGLSSLKIGVEYFLIALQLVIAAVLLWQPGRTGLPEESRLVAALGIMVLSELCFTLYTQVFDAFNVLGHVYKTVAYYLIYRSVFAASVRIPYQQLQASEAALKEAERRVLALNASLEQRVEERTAQLSRSNAELERFAYVASHDLQEPLRMVSSYVQLIERRYKDKLDDDGREFIDYVVAGATRMQGMVNDLLEYSRVQTRGRSFADVNLDAVLAEVLVDLKLAIEENAGTVTQDPLPLVEGDASQFRRVFLNLVSNAIKYRGEAAPRIHVSARRIEDAPVKRPDRSPARGWLISVSDNGIGIEAQYFGKLFQLFQRLHTHDKYPGTGLGLALCKRIVERHRGAIWVDSSPGEGSVFYVALPDIESH
jgi:signal transduction histidine kinase